MKAKAREVEAEVVGEEPTVNRAAPIDDPFVALVARLMDTQFVIPGTNIRFGLDPLIGLIPGFGDTLATFVSVLLIAQSAQYRLPRIVLARMGLNALINAALGSLPVIGDAFSLWFKSNIRNYELLRRHAGTANAASRSDWLFVVGIIVAILVVAGLAIAAMVTLWMWIFSALRAMGS